MGIRNSHRKTVSDEELKAAKGTPKIREEYKYPKASSDTRLISKCKNSSKVSCGWC